MAEKAPPSDEEPAPDEEFVAYLDGELDAREAGAVEARLASDDVARTKVQSLQKTYDLLDYLPKPEPSPTFATRTLTKLEPVSATVGVNGVPTAAAISSIATQSQSDLVHRASWRYFVGWTVSALVAALVGYLGHLIAKPHLNAKATPQTSQQVRLLERLPLYVGVDDLDFLKKLDESDLFPDVEHEGDSPNAKSASDNVSASDLAALEESFRKLPTSRQQQLRQLDDAFSALEPSQQTHLNATLERYAVWLDRLPEAYRREILSEPAAAERLEAIRRVKVRLWREHLPLVVKAKLAETADKDEVERILADYRSQEAARRKKWHLARQEWASANSDRRPYPFNDPELTRQVEEYVSTVLRPRLPPKDQVEIDEIHKEVSQGGYLAFYYYGVTILDASEKHPMFPEPKNGKPITKVDDLPQEFLRKLRQPSTGPNQPPKREFRLMPQHGKWPEFAELIAREAQERNIVPPVPLGPSRPSEFKSEIEEIVTTLKTKLTAKEKADLDAQQGKWPGYPRMFLDLAKKYDISVPGLTLPGSPQQWLKVYPPKVRR